MSGTGSQPLAGVTVADFSTLLPGPMATLLLAEAGAEVIKIERPGGENMRRYAPLWGEMSASFALLNRGKRCVALDLKEDAGRARALEIAAAADVVVEQFRPGVMDRLGLGYDAVKAKNPRTIYCSITGYGQTGPKRDVAGHDLNYIGDAGLLALSMGEPGHRVVPPALIADIAGGAYPAVMNILLALRARDARGEGAFLDIAMAENALPFAFWGFAAGHTRGEWPGEGNERLSGGSPRYRLYDTADGRVMAVAALEDKFWGAFCAAIGLPEGLCDDEKDPAATAAGVAALVAAKGSEEWRPILAAADCCCTIVEPLKEAASDPHFAAREVFSKTISNANGARMPALPVPVAPQFRAAHRDEESPALGED